MPAQNWFVLTSAQRDAVMAFNTTDYQIDPRAVDAASPGVGLNLNAGADGFAAGAALALVGNYVAPYRIVNDPQYIASIPAMVTYLNQRPSALLDSDAIFAPPPPL
jgi:hypothetical protein